MNVDLDCSSSIGGSFCHNSDAEDTPSHLILTNLGKVRYKPKLERAHRDVVIRTQYITHTIKEKHKGYVVKKLVCSLDPNDPIRAQSPRDSSSFTNEEIEMDSVLNHLALNDMLGISDDTESQSGTDDSVLSFSPCHDVSYYLDEAARVLQEVSTDSDVLTNISSIELVSNTGLASNKSSDVLSDVSSIQDPKCEDMSEYQRRTV